MTELKLAVIHNKVHDKKSSALSFSPVPLIEYRFMRVECLALRDLHVIMAPSDSLPAERAPLQYNQRPRNVFCCANAPSLTQKDE